MDDIQIDDVVGRVCVLLFSAIKPKLKMIGAILLKIVILLSLLSIIHNPKLLSKMCEILSQGSCLSYLLITGLHV